MCHKKVEESVEYDEKFKGIPQYKLHPQMIPFVGKYYSQSEKRLLLIAQNPVIGEVDEQINSLKENNINQIIDDWYIKGIDKIEDENNTSVFRIVEQWTNLNKNIISYAKGDFLRVPNSQYLFPAIVTASEDIDFFNRNHENIFSYIVFTDFFQKPHLPETFKPSDIDIEKSIEILKEIVKIIEPTHIFITSYEAQKIFESHNVDILIDKNNIGNSCHPMTKWWNKKYGEEKKSGKERFQEFIRKNEIFVNT
jgi:hypothetical protein